MTPEPIRWYALKVFYRRTMAIKAELDKLEVPNYVALKPVERMRRGRKVIEQVPLVESLLFLQTTETFLMNFKFTHEKSLLFYQDFATKKPAPIDDVEMRSFIILTSADRGTRVEYLGENVPDFKRGEHVRVIGGLYEGAEGYIRKVRSDRKLVVEVKGVAVVAVSYIEPALLEKI